MTMHCSYLKEHEGTDQNPAGQLPSAAVPWWSGLGPSYTEPLSQTKFSFLEQPNSGGQLTANKQGERGTGQGPEKGSTTQFTIFPGDRKKIPNMSVPSAPPEYQGRFEIGFGQSVICAKYPYADQCYGLFSTYGPQIAGRIMLTADDGPIYVNAKQYHGIIRRRLSRAKAVSENKVLRVRKPYLHRSRHLHAMRRPRGSGGRFLNTKASKGAKGGTDKEKAGNGQLSPLTESQNSEVLQSDSGNSNGRRSNPSGSEVTSMFFRGEVDRFMCPLSLWNALPSKWMASADSCCNLKV